MKRGQSAPFFSTPEMENKHVVATSPAAAILLNQITYWHRPTKNGKSRLRVFKGGYWWVAKTYKELWVECGLTRKQVERATKKLLELGLVDVQIFKFNKAPTRHFRLIPIAPNGAFPLLQMAQSITDTTSTQQEATSTNVDVASAGIVIPATATANPSAKKENGGKIGNGSFLTTFSAGGKMKADEVLLNFDKKHAVIPDTQIVKNATDMATWWVKLMAKYHPAGFVKSLTDKEVGQLGHLRKATEKVGPYEVMRWAVMNWVDFLIDIRKETGDTLTMKRPQIGVLLKYAEVAVHGLHKA